MAFSNGFGDRADDLRFRSPQSPIEDSSLTYSSPLSPSRGTFPGKIHTQMQNQTSSSNDARASLHRRFTMNALPTLSPIGQQRRLAAEPQDHSNNVRLIVFSTFRNINSRDYNGIFNLVSYDWFRSSS